MSWQADVEPPPAILVLPPGDVDLGEADAAIELWEHYSRKTLDDTQRLAVQVMMAQTRDGKWAAASTGREMPRQNGKGDEIEVVELWGLVQRAEAILHTVHDAVLLASQTQQRMLGVLEGHADLRRLVKRKWQGTGQQMIQLRNGGVIWYRTRTGGGGRGVDDVDRLVIDEAQHATEAHLAAVSPTLLANPNPQLNALGTAGVAGVSEWWWRMRRRALGPDPGQFGYVGHTAEKVSIDPDGHVVQEPVDVEDRDLWRSSNPALAAGRGGGMAFLEEQLRILGPDAFAREHLGVWDPPDDSGGASVIDPAAWDALVDIEQTRPSPVALAVEVSPDRKWASIALAGRRSDGRTHVQIVQSGKGTGWVLDRLVELNRKWRPRRVALDPGGPAGSLLADIQARGLPVKGLTGRELCQACGMFVDAVEEQQLAHSGQPVLSVAVGNARRRTRGDSWVFDPPPSGVDISPLKGVVCAVFALAASSTDKKRSGLVVGIR